MTSRLLLYLRAMTLLIAASCSFLTASATHTGRMFTDPVFSSGVYKGFCRDNDGFLWIATEGGLLKFDGNNYVLYRHEENDSTTLSDSRMITLLTDTKGRVWAATANGLNLYNPYTDSFKRIKLPSMSYDGFIIDITEQHDGTITFIVAGTGLFLVDETSGEPRAVRYSFNLTDESQQDCVTQGKNGNLYIGLRSGIVYSVSPNGQPKPIKVANGYFNGMIAEADGNILVNSVNELYRIYIEDGHRVEKIFSSDDPKMRLDNFTLGADGIVYMSTSGNGIWKIAPGQKKIEPYSSIYLPSIDIHNAKLGAIYADKHGNLWIGCQYKGVACIPYNSIPFNYHLISDAFNDFRGGFDGFAVCGDKIALGYGNTVMVVTPEGKKLFQKEIKGKGDICSIKYIGGDKVLLGISNDGIYEMSLKDGSLRSILEIPGKYLSIEMCDLPGGDLLIGFYGLGLMRYNPVKKTQKWYPYDSNGGRLNNPFISTMKITPDSAAVWIGLYGGISNFDIKADTLLTLNQSPFIKGATYAFAPLDDGSVLAGTSHGLIHYATDGNVRRKFTTNDGLTDNDIRSISVDPKGGKWIGTQRGLSYMPANSEEIVVYYGGYGLFEKTFPFSGELSDNRIVLGSNLGITVFNPDSIPAVSFKGKVKVSSIMLNGERINRSTEIDGKKVMKGEEPLCLRLPYKNNSLTFNLSTLDFRDAANVRYLWRLTGYSDKWTTTAPGDNVVYLPHLDPGKYELHIKAMDNNVSSDETIVTIAISTPWYMSIVAKAIYAIIFLALIALILIVMAKKREEKMNEAKIRFFIDVSHDIRSPTTLILTPLESLLKEPLPAAVNEKLRTMYRNGQRILSLVNQLLDLRKIEKGGMRLLCRQTELDTFIEELVEMFKPQAADKKISLGFKNEGGVPQKTWVDRDNFDKILVNIISNAIKYTPDGGNIEVVLKGVDDENLGKCAQVSVIDTGIGLGNKTQEQIFERFYRARENHSSGIAGVGIGLDLCRQLTLLHHGTISGANRSDGVKGSVFTVRIPLAEDAYAPSELHRKENADGENAPSDKHLRIDKIHPSESADKPRKKRLAISRRILVVDDDAELLKYIQRHLEETGYKTETANNGSDAMKIINKGEIDLVVSDVKMPVMDGLTFLRLMRSNVNTHHIPFIILSSKNEIADRIEGWEHGADGYLGKPFNIEELDTMIENLIGNRLKLKGKYSGAQNTDNLIAPPDVKGYDEALMEKIMRIINEHIDNPELNVEMLGQSIGISRVQLHRKLKEIIGMTPSDFIRNIRLKRACLLLEKPDLEVTQVAYAVGFSSQPHFSTAFKRYTGFSPTEYRAKCQSGDTPPRPVDPTDSAAFGTVEEPRP